MASVLHSDEPLQCLTHHCTALQVQEHLTRTPRDRLRTHGHIAFARSMEFNKDSLGVMRVLLEQPEIQVNLPEIGGEEGNTLLHLAVSIHDEDENDEKHDSPLKLILQRADVDPNVGNSKGDTPLHSAARVSSVPCVDILLDDPRVNVAAVNYDKQTSLHVACEACSTKTSDRIARKVIDSARSTVRSLPRFLRKQDQCGNTGLHYAAARGLENVVDAFFEAENLGDKNELAAKQNQHGNLAIHLAAKNGHHGVVERMLVLVNDSHVDDVVVNIKDQDGFGLLHHAVRSGCQEILQLCIQRLPKTTTSTFNLCMELLGVARHKNITDFLLQSLNHDYVKNLKRKEDDYLANLLHFAVSEKRETLVQLIVKWYPKQAVIAMHKALETRNETIQTMLRDHPEVQREFVKLHKAYTYYVTAANAILVVAVLIVTVTAGDGPTALEAAQQRNGPQEHGAPAPAPGKGFGGKEVRFTDFVILERWAFFQAIVATILAAFAALPFSFAFFFHEAVDDTQVKRLLYRTRVLIVLASYFLMLSIGALVFAFVCSQFIAPYIDYKCTLACEVALSVSLLCATLFLGFNFVHYWRTRMNENGRPGPTRDREDAGKLEMLCYDDKCTICVSDGRLGVLIDTQ